MLDDSPKLCAGLEWSKFDMMPPDGHAPAEEVPCDLPALPASEGGQCAGCGKRFCGLHLYPQDHHCKEKHANRV